MAQPAPTAGQCTAVFTGVMIRNGVPLTDSLTADLTAVVVSREAALLEYLAARARTQVEQVLAHGLRAEAFRDGLTNAAIWLCHAATAAARRAEDATKRQRALQRRPATVTHGPNGHARPRHGHPTAGCSADSMRENDPDAAQGSSAIGSRGMSRGRTAPGW